MLVAPMDTSIRKLPLIYAVQRLGVNYHFEKEIEDALEAIYHENNEADNDLHTTSLRFRLLREHDFDVPCEAIYKFKYEEGNFKSSLRNDVQGLLELYEASYMRVHGEDILDEAISFTTTHLTLAAATLDYPLGNSHPIFGLHRSGATFGLKYPWAAQASSSLLLLILHNVGY
ncbi:hypothetical protein Gotri_022150 [Gossypium trilobum]|uniref:Terpene synthase N-terminal domain-containing protein n=1 Tax=Gossypium trilobum TaxID=34281 RepID=A0A7J9DFK9_9ROSI|nr:hypothetical protein [Gossypium trilobum]